MRVDYTLPALQPGTVSGSPEVAAEDSLSFRDVIRGETVRTPVSVEQQLRLDVRPYTAKYIGPPPKPTNLDLQGPESQRYHWRNILWRHDLGPEQGGHPDPSHGKPVQTMLHMLSRMQDMEDEIVAQDGALTRG